MHSKKKMLLYTKKDENNVCSISSKWYYMYIKNNRLKTMCNS